MAMLVAMFTIAIAVAFSISVGSVRRGIEWDVPFGQMVGWSTGSLIGTAVLAWNVVTGAMQTGTPTTIEFLIAAAMLVVQTAIGLALYAYIRTNPTSS